MPILLSFFLWISNQAKISIDWISTGALFPIVSNLWVWQSMFQVTLVIISTSVFIYCWFYMEPTEYTRFSITILVFIMAMMIFICHESLLMLLTGWDGLGASSFLLVIHYWSWGSLSGGLTTLLTNRVGDICIFMFFGACVVSSSSDDFSLMQTMAPQVFLIMSGCTKSAQVPFSSWLPLAMSAPTPVSSLVHSSTLVTAGVYLFQRYFYCLTDSILCYLLIIGLATSVVGGFGAMVEPDTKKVIAMSTLSQLGFLTLALGSSLPMLSFTHLLTHAMLKSCLFLQVGTAIHAMASSQNSQLWVGNSALGQSHPILVGGSLMSMCGLGFLSGFMSKDAVLGGIYTNSSSIILVIILMASIGLTISYSIKIWWDLYVTGSIRCVSSMDTTHTIMPSIPLFLGGVAFGWIIQWNYLPVTITGLQEEKGLPLFIPPLVALLLIMNLNTKNVMWNSIPLNMFGLDMATRESSFLIHKTMVHHELTVSPASYLNTTKFISNIVKEPVWVGVPFVFSLLCLIMLVSL